MTKEEIKVELARLGHGCTIIPITIGHLWWKKIIGYDLSAKPSYWFKIGDDVCHFVSIGINDDFTKIELKGDGVE